MTYKARLPRPPANSQTVKHVTAPSIPGHSQLIAQVLEAVRVPGTTFHNLQVFADALDEDAVDLVSELMRKSTGTEIVSLLNDATKLKAPDIALIFTVLEKIILTIASELTILESAAQEIAEIILTKHQRTLYYMLKTTNKSNQIKSCLKLLIALATLGPKTVKLILTHFDFGTSNLAALFSRRNTVDPQDVRACVIHFLVALIMFGDNTSIRLLISTKNLLNGIFAGLIVDRSEIIELFLSTLLDRIVKNVAIPKTSKVQLFNQSTLKQLLKTLRWNGHKKSEKEFSEDDWTAKVQATEKESVQAAVMQILTAVCSSHKHGIVFQDLLYGSGPKNCNHILTDLLKGLSFSSAAHRELAADVLVSAPDQLVHFLPTWKPGFIPRASDKWSAMMDWLSNIYARLDVANKMRKISSKSRVRPLLTLDFPPIFDQELQLEAFKINQPDFVAVKMLTSVNECLVRIYGIHSLLSAEEKLELTSDLRNVLVDPSVVVDCLRRISTLANSAENLKSFFDYLVMHGALFSSNAEFLFGTDDNFQKLFATSKSILENQFAEMEKNVKSVSDEVIEEEFNAAKIQLVQNMERVKRENQALRTGASLLLLELSDQHAKNFPIQLKRVIMESYTATLSAADQNLFKIIRSMDDDSMSPGISYSVFGNSARKQNEFQSANNSFVTFQPTMREFVDSLNTNLMKRTAYNFPIRLPLYGETSLVDDNVYDPRYLLANFAALLNGSPFNASHFVESGCLSIVFSALGSLDGAMRAAAGMFLKRFSEVAYKLKFKGKEQLLYILTQIQRSNRPQKAWPNLWTICLNKFLEVMFDSENHIYQILMEYFLVKAEFALDKVPEFLKMFASGKLSHAKERRFILELIRDGMRHYQDYELMERSHAWEMILSMCGSSLSNKALNLMISELLVSASKVPFVGRRLAKTFSLFSWITFQIGGNIHEPETVANLISCCRNCLADVTLSKKRSLYHFTVDLMVEDLLKSAQFLESGNSAESTLCLIVDATRFCKPMYAQSGRMWTWEQVDRVVDICLRRLREVRVQMDGQIWRAKCGEIAGKLDELEMKKKSGVKQVTEKHVLELIFVLLTKNDKVDDLD